MRFRRTYDRRSHFHNQNVLHSCCSHPKHRHEADGSLLPSHFPYNLLQYSLIQRPIIKCRTKQSERNSKPEEIGTRNIVAERIRNYPSSHAPHRSRASSCGCFHHHTLLAGGYSSGYHMEHYGSWILVRDGNNIGFLIMC